MRLPPESVIACKRVCKLWYNLIHNKLFVNKHIEFNIKNTTISFISLFLKWTRQEHPQHELSKLELSLFTISRNVANSCANGGGDDDHYLCAIEQVHLPPVPVIERLNFPENIAGCHCHGIICLFDYYCESSVVLCNPNTQEIQDFTYTLPWP